MAQLKTTPNDQDVHQFLEQIEDERKRKDSFEVLDIMQKITKEEPQMWGDSIIGFGRFTLKYANGREGEWFLTGFSPRKQSLTLYIMSGFDGYPELLDKLGKHSTGKSCLYIKKLDDVDTKTLKKLVKQSVKHMKKTNPK